MIRPDTDMCGARFDQLEHAAEHADHGAERWIVALGEAAESVEVSEQLVRSVDQMNDHAYVISSSA